MIEELKLLNKEELIGKILQLENENRILRDNRLIYIEEYRKLVKENEKLVGGSQ